MSAVAAKYRVNWYDDCNIKFLVTLWTCDSVTHVCLVTWHPPGHGVIIILAPSHLSLDWSLALCKYSNYNCSVGWPRVTTLATLLSCFNVFIKSQFCWCLSITVAALSKHSATQDNTIWRELSLAWTGHPGVSDHAWWAGHPCEAVLVVVAQLVWVGVCHHWPLWWTWVV